MSSTGSGVHIELPVSHVVARVEQLGADIQGHDWRPDQIGTEIVLGSAHIVRIESIEEGAGSGGDRSQAGGAGSPPGEARGGPDRSRVHHTGEAAKNGLAYCGRPVMDERSHRRRGGRQLEASRRTNDRVIGGEARASDAIGLA